MFDCFAILDLKSQSRKLHTHHSRTYMVPCVSVCWYFFLSFCHSILFRVALLVLLFTTFFFLFHCFCCYFVLFVNFLLAHISFIEPTSLEKYDPNGTINVIYKTFEKWGSHASRLGSTFQLQEFFLFILFVGDCCTYKKWNIITNCRVNDYYGFYYPKNFLFHLKSMNPNSEGTFMCSRCCEWREHVQNIHWKEVKVNKQWERNEEEKNAFFLFREHWQHLHIC